MRRAVSATAPRRLARWPSRSAAARRPSPPLAAAAPRRALASAPRALEGAQLTSALKHERSPSKMLLLLRHGVEVNDIHLSAAAMALARRVRETKGAANLKQLRGSAGYEELMGELGAATIEMAEKQKLDPQAIANLAWAYAGLEVDHPALMRSLSLAAVQRRAQLNEQAVSMLMRAYSALGIFDEELFGALVRRAAELAPQMTEVAVASLLSSFARLRILDDGLIRQIGRRTSALLQGRGLRGQNTVTMAWALARLNAGDAELIGQLTAHGMSEGTDLRSGNGSNLAWAMAVENQFTEESARWVWADVERAWRANELKGINAKQAHQALLTLRLEYPRWQPPPAITDIAEELRVFFAQESADFAATQRRSNFELAVERLVEARFPGNVEGAVTIHEGYSVDMLVRPFDLIVEVDGPQHFVHGSRRPLGSTLMKHRHLRAAGWKTVNVGYWESDAVLRGTWSVDRALAEQDPNAGRAWPDNAH